MMIISAVVVKRVSARSRYARGRGHRYRGPTNDKGAAHQRECEAAGLLAQVASSSTETAPAVERQFSGNNRSRLVASLDPMCSSSLWSLHRVQLLQISRRRALGGRRRLRSG